MLDMAYDNGALNEVTGLIDDIEVHDDIIANDNASISISDGTADDFLLGDNAAVSIDFLTGGDDIEARSGSVITIFGTDFTVLGMPAAFGPIPFVAGDIQGTLADGSAFDVTFRRDFGLNNAAQIVLVNLPEPSTGLLLLSAPALLSLAPRRRGV